MNSPLIDYYDEVVLPGFRLAAEDQQRGTIDRSRTAQILRSMTEVIEDLGDHATRVEDVAAMIEARAPRVICIAGRGAFDANVSAVIVQLLDQQGIKAEHLPLIGVPRETVASLDLAAFDTIVFSYLGPPSTQARLIRRLRQRAPSARILIGPMIEATPALPDVIKAAEPNDYYKSFRELVSLIVGDFAGRATCAVRPVSNEMPALPLDASGLKPSST